MFEEVCQSFSSQFYIATFSSNSNKQIVTIEGAVEETLWTNRQATQIRNQVNVVTCLYRFQT